MAAIDPGTLMWARACELIDRAERLHRQFFQPTAAPVRELCWEPPVDVIETDSELLISVALPGVDSNAPPWSTRFSDTHACTIRMLLGSRGAPQRFRVIPCPGTRQPTLAPTP